MVRATKLDLQRMHDVLKKYGAKYDKNDEIIKGSYRRGAIKAASEALGKDRRTIYNWLDKFPKRPERELRKKPVIPKYVAEFMESETVKDFIEKRVGASKNREHLTIGLTAWRILGQKDPISWTEEDYQTLWRHPDFRDEMTGKISYHKAGSLRAWMTHCKMYDTLKVFDTKGLKRDPGSKKTHWLKSEDEIEGVINGIQYPDTLMMLFLGIQCGARFSSIKLTKPSQIDYTTNMILMRETKTSQILERDFPPETLATLKQYIYDFDFKGNQKIFPRRLEMINNDLKQAGENAGITFPLTSHVAMKHTFVSLASNRGVSLEVVSKQTGTDPKTLMDFYAGLDRRKIRHELIGEEYEEPTYHEVIKAINQAVKKRYAQIKGKLIAVDGLAKKDGRKTTELPEPKKRKRNWKSIEGIVNSPKTKPHLVKYWKPRLALHKKGLSDAQIEKRMKKSA